MEPQLKWSKWNKIILAAKIILFHVRHGSVLKIKHSNTLKFFKIILFYFMMESRLK